MAEGSRAVGANVAMVAAAEEPSGICVMKFDTRSETDVERAPILRYLPTEGRGGIASRLALISNGKLNAKCF